MRLRERATSLALAVTVGLTIMKLGVGVFSGSIGVISEGVHSFLDLISATVAFFTVREAGKPADREHPFGHGKIETLSSLFESLFLVAAALLIVTEGYRHFRNPQPIDHENLAIGTILISMIVSYWVYRQNHATAQTTESSAIRVNALHFLSDVAASGGILIGLILLKFTGWLIIDPIMAFAVAAYILLISAQQVKQALNELTDTQLPTDEVKKIEEILDDFTVTRKRAIEAHDLRTRRSGATRHIDFHLLVCGEMSVNESHGVCDDIETEISAVFPNASVNIHVEPCEANSASCREHCAEWRKNK